MTKYLAVVLTVIAIGVLLVAYGLLNPQSAMVDIDGTQRGMRAVPVGDAIALRESLTTNPFAGTAYVPVTYVAAGSTAPGFTAVGAADRTGIAVAPQYMPYATPAVISAPAPQPVRTVASPQPAPRRTSRAAEPEPRRDWKRTAMVIGGSSAAGAGVGALIGGRKGALIGAAIGGGAGTVYEVAK